MAKTTPAPPADAEQDEPKPEAPDEATGAPDATTDATTGADAPPASEAPRTPGENRFFTWIRSLDLPREPGWIGGVCAGIAARLRIDPLIVRGIVVVLAVLGAPIVLAYAAAWLLLPDRNGQIHAQELGRGHVTPAFPAIVGLALLSFLPLTQGFWYLGGIYWGEPDVVGGIVRAVWMAVVVAAVVVLVVWLARRATGDITTGPATTDDRPETIPSTPGAERSETDAAGTAAAGAVAGATGTTGVTEPIVLLPSGEPVQPAPLPADASADELAAWKASQAEWQRQRAEWVAEQNRAEYERRQAERRARSAEAAAAAVERRRIQKIVRPRAGGAVIALVFGLTLVAGAVAAFVASTNPETVAFTAAIGIATATTVIGVSAVVVGLARRRSGFLAFLGIVGVIATLISLVLPQDRQLLAPGFSYGVASTHDSQVIQLAGTTSTYVSPVSTQDRSTLDVWQLAGDVDINLAPDATVRIEAVTASGDAPYLTLWNKDGSVATASLKQISDEGNGAAGYEALIGTGAPDLVVRIWLGSGVINIFASSNDTVPLLPVFPAPENVTPFEPSPNGMADDYNPFSTQGAHK